MKIFSRHYCNYVSVLILFYCIILSLNKTGFGLANSSNTATPVYLNNQTFTCHNLTNANQRIMCFTTPGLLKAIVDAEQLARKECSNQLEYERWNCSGFAVITPSNVTKYATAETAAIHSLMSAALAHVVTRDCRFNGMQCECGKNTTISSAGNQVMYGCSSNWEFGMEMSAKFMDGKEKHGVVIGDRQLINLQNNQVGRTVFLDVNHKKEPTCKCVGVSASCSAKTCQRGLEAFSVVAASIKDKYKKSCKVSVKASALQPHQCNSSSISNTTLVHTLSSPDYCHKDISKGSFGVQGRLCDPAVASKSCETICCGRGHIEFTKDVEGKCCKQVGCCGVQCNDCKRTLTFYACR
ncbi:uncharacterized protein LOC100636289 [Amphimedon queenslandica]|uniref:Protein Wnt n=1 Tax=Amphimedon queenslandica TaxID=400682 RepID=E2IJ93_AMPQE|nr:uncharacterized protein LOC100636289 [Amphimedon queenslandica]ADO16565.1 WntC [Amphimedon queenslandica]|eukprot:NP_001292181.1 uncharacterized protein LOC100636289 [Amphimedon queenslandica]